MCADACAGRHPRQCERMSPTQWVTQLFLLTLACSQLRSSQVSAKAVLDPVKLYGSVQVCSSSTVLYLASSTSSCTVTHPPFTLFSLPPSLPPFQAAQACLSVTWNVATQALSRGNSVRGTGVGGGRENPGPPLKGVGSLAGQQGNTLGGRRRRMGAHAQKNAWAHGYGGRQLRP